MRRRGTCGLLILAAVSATSGCDVLGPTVCTREARPALRVEVLDSLSLEPIRGDVRVSARVGAFVDAVVTETFPLDPSVNRDTVVFGPFGLAHERAGTYEVTAEAAGYAPWQRSAIRVGEDECHVRTVNVTALLERSDP